MAGKTASALLSPLFKLPNPDYRFLYYYLLDAILEVDFRVLFPVYTHKYDYFLQVALILKSWIDKTEFCLCIDICSIPPLSPIPQCSRLKDNLDLGFEGIIETWNLRPPKGKHVRDLIKSSMLDSIQFIVSVLNLN